MLDGNLSRLRHGSYTEYQAFLLLYDILRDDKLGRVSIVHARSFLIEYSGQLLLRISFFSNN
jgi:hypothetical protein